MKKYINSIKIAKPKHQPPPKVSITDVLAIADKISQETGKYISYGKVEVAIMRGEIRPEEYLRGDD